MEQSLTQRMREELVPQGTSQVVKLQLGNLGYIDYPFVLKCIDEIDGLHVRHALGDPISNLERLAIMLLMDSAYIETPKKEEK